MIHLGSPEEWFDLLDPFIPDILELVAATWPTLPAPAGDEREDTITEALCRALRRSRTGRTLPFRIDIQQVELDAAAGEDQGRIDVTFSPLIPREDIYFALECKRLNVREPAGTVRPCHAEYVQHGMARFVSGQYGAAVHVGGMLGYVLDGQTDNAINGVEANVRRQHAALCMASPGSLLRSRLRPGDVNARESHHNRPAGNPGFTIHHLFVACDPATPLRERPTGRRSRSQKRQQRRQDGCRPHSGIRHQKSKSWADDAA